MRRPRAGASETSQFQTAEDIAIDSSLSNTQRRSQQSSSLQVYCSVVNVLCILFGAYLIIERDWSGGRLCCGGIGGASLLRARRRAGESPTSKSVLLFHGALLFELATHARGIVPFLLESQFRGVDDDYGEDGKRADKEHQRILSKASPSMTLIGREIGYDDSMEVGWAQDLDTLSENEVASRHARLLADAVVARHNVERRVPETMCWRTERVLQCIPKVYLLGMPKSGTSELWGTLVHHPKILKARRKETRFFTRGEFARSQESYLDDETQLGAFANEHRDAAAEIDKDLIDSSLKSDLILIDGGPHTLWWSTQAFDGSDTGAAPVPQLLRALVPTAKLIVTLAEPARRSYSDYWFLTERGVVRPDFGDSKPQHHPEQSPEDFDAKMRIDTQAMELCFDRFSEDDTNVHDQFGWPLVAVQRCAYDRYHFGRNGRGRIAVGLYVAFIARWLDFFDRSQLLVVRLEDRTHHLDLVWQFLGLEPILEEGATRRVNEARSARPPMLPDTARLLRAFFAPHNSRLASFLGDERFLWRDALPNQWANVTGRDAPKPRRKPQPYDTRGQRDDGTGPIDGLLEQRRDKQPKQQDADLVNTAEKPSPKESRSSRVVKMAALGETTYLKQEVAARRELGINLLQLPRELSEALVLAALRVDPNTVAALLDAGADPNVVLFSDASDERAAGASPLHVACLAACWGDSMRGSLVFKLLEGSASPVDAAISYGETDAGRKLLTNRSAGRTTVGALEIRLALEKAVAATVRALLAQGANATATDDKARTPAHYCAQSGFPDALDALVHSSSDTSRIVNAVESVHGATPAHLAALWGQGDALRTLVVNHNADAVGTLDKHGHSVRDIASGPGAAVAAFLAEDSQLRAALGNVDVPQPVLIKREPPKPSGGWRPADPREYEELNPRSQLRSEKDADECDFAVVDAAGLDGRTLFTDYITQNRPVLIRGILDTPDWDRARDAFSVDKLLEQHGEYSVTVSAIPYAKKFASSDGQRNELLSVYVAEMLNFTLAGDKIPWYVFKGHPVSRMPNAPEEAWFVDPDVVPPPETILDAFARASNFSQPKSSPHREVLNEADPYERAKQRFWPFVNVQWALGSAGSGAPMHFHNTAWNACVYGAKRWIAYPPAFNVMSNDQIRVWDQSVRPLDEIPYGRNPKAFECIQRQGDVAIIPELWGHGVLNLQDTVAVAIEVKGSLFRAPLPRAYKQLQILTRPAKEAGAHPPPRPSVRKSERNRK